MGNLDWIIAQAMGNQPVDAELHRLRLTEEARLRDVRQHFLEARAEAQEWHAKLQREWATVPTPHIDSEARLAPVAVLLPRLTHDLRQAETALEAFRSRHGLTRAPRTPHAVQSLVFLAMFVLIEAAGNTGFFLNAHLAAGPLAALLISLLIALTNVTFCASAGFFIGRWKSYGLQAIDGTDAVFTTVRWRARSLFWVFVAVLGLFHSTVGLVRAQETLDRVQPSLSGYWSVLTTPEALFLVLLGLCLSALAYHKGLSAFADPYPGYGVRHQAVLEARDALLDLHEETAEGIAEDFDEAQDALTHAWSAYQRSQKKATGQVQTALAARRDLVRAVGEAESRLRQQIAQVAGHHRAARGDRTPLSDGALDRLAAFDDLLADTEPPSFAHPPDIAAEHAQLEQGRAEALRRLRDLFATVLDCQPGGDHP